MERNKKQANSPSYSKVQLETTNQAPKKRKKTIPKASQSTKKAKAKKVESEEDSDSDSDSDTSPEDDDEDDD